MDNVIFFRTARANTVHYIRVESISGYNKRRNAESVRQQYLAHVPRNCQFWCGHAATKYPLIRSGVLSHIAAGGWWTTVITLVNTSSAAVPVTVALHNDDGSAMTLPVTTRLQGTSQTTTTSSVSATINPNATLLISMGDPATATVVGWADVLGSGSIGGYAIFRSTPQPGLPSEGTVAA